MGQALYRKYRSGSLDEIVGQEHITDTIRSAIKSGHISHAYLFTGPRGVGKTSIARILAHEISGLPYVKEGAHIDIIEIDAASNRGIDEIRDLREKVYMAPVEGKRKVYIIDEVHMLTTQAFNALLKTLEEPPEHVVFILATTDAHKVPETIVSRTQRYIFRPVDESKVVAHLRHIATEENIDIDDEALGLIAQHGGGSFRDSISLLDQAAGRGVHVDAEIARTMLGVPPETTIHRIISAIQNSDIASLTKELNALEIGGFQAAATATSLNEQLRASLIAGRSELDQQTQLSLLRKLLDVPASTRPERLLELVLIEAMSNHTVPAQQAPVAPKVVVGIESVNPAPQLQTPPKATAVASEPVITQQKAEPAQENTPEEPIVKLAAELKPFDAEIWAELLQALKKQYNTLYGVARMAQPVIDDDKLVLRFKFAFHQKRMHEAKHRKIVSDILEQLTGKVITIECVFDKNSVPQPAVGATTATPAKPTTNPVGASVNTISDIFGGGELLES